MAPSGGEGRGLFGPEQPPIMSLSRHGAVSARHDSNAGVDAPLNHSNRSLQPGLDQRGRDMQAVRRLAGGETLVQTQIDNLAVGLREEQDDLPQQGKELLFLGESFRASAGILHFREGDFFVTHAPPANILGGIGDNLTHPGTSLGAVEAGMIDGLHDLDPTGLEGVFSEAIAADYPLGEGKEAFRTAGDPCFLVPFQEGAFPGGREVQNAQTPGHEQVLDSTSKTVYLNSIHLAVVAFEALNKNTQARCGPYRQ